MKKVTLVSRDGIIEEVSPRNIPDHIRKMFNVMLHYSQSKSINGRKIRMIIFDCFSTKDEIIITGLRKQFNKDEYLTQRQFALLVRYYRMVLETVL